MTGTTRRCDDAALRGLAESVAAFCRSRGALLATAESCTGGWIAKVATDLPGSSDWFVAGLVTYGNDAKSALLGVPPTLITKFGAVSEPVVRAMAEGALARTTASVSVSVSGIAGPAGGSSDKPVGTVWFGWSRRDGGVVATRSEQHRFDGDREAVRRQAVAEALAGILVP